MDSDVVVDHVCGLLRHKKWSSLEKMVPRLNPSRLYSIICRCSQKPRVALEFFLWVKKQLGLQHTVDSYCVTIDVMRRWRRARAYAWVFLQRLPMQKRGGLIFRF
ncbi:hypothetical protein SUGI_1068520 [Cryptomeria japonica]|nr:hypothetical protein SUGI_1068520 [Cryptomeria japonica]